MKKSKLQKFRNTQSKKDGVWLSQVNEPSHMCEECCRVNQARKTFKYDLSMKSKEKLKLVHSYYKSNVTFRSVIESV